jgi:hypothetical protein
MAVGKGLGLAQRPAVRIAGHPGVWARTMPGLVATAQSIDADVVGADRAAFERLGSGWLRFR